MAKKQSKIVHRVPDEIRVKSVETLEVKPEVIMYLQTHGYETIEDVIKNQDKLPKEIIVPIRAKLIFGIDL